MRPMTRLSQFVADGLRAGHSAETLANTLRAQGWAEKDVALALADWTDAGLGVPVPRPSDRAALRDAVVYALIFASLFAIAWHSVQFGVELVDVVFPDGPREWWGLTSLRWSFSVLVVTLPVFAALHIHAARAVARNPARAANAFRARIAAVALFLVALVLLGDAVAVVFAALGGEITARFIAKAGVLAGVALMVAAYYRLTAPVTD